MPSVIRHLPMPSVIRHLPMPSVICHLPMPSVIRHLPMPWSEARLGTKLLKFGFAAHCNHADVQIWPHFLFWLNL
jgi:hypothetical protein